MNRPDFVNAVEALPEVDDWPRLEDDLLWAAMAMLVVILLALLAVAVYVWAMIL